LCNSRGNNQQGLIGNDNSTTRCGLLVIAVALCCECFAGGGCFAHLKFEPKLHQDSNAPRFIRFVQSYARTLPTVDRVSVMNSRIKKFCEKTYHNSNSHTRQPITFAIEHHCLCPVPLKKALTLYFDIEVLEVEAEQLCGKI
jgi:hypothetical protein